MSSKELDDLISSSTIRIRTGSVEGADCPPSFSQVATCCTALACKGIACLLRILQSASRLQLVVTVPIFRSCHVEGAVRDGSGPDIETSFRPDHRRVRMCPLPPSSCSLSEKTPAAALDRFPRR